MSGKKRGSGSTLDIGNTAAVAFLWKTLAQERPGELKTLTDAVNDKGDKSYQLLRRHDPALQSMLRNWVQSTYLISREIAERVAEIEAIAKEAAVAAVVDSMVDSMESVDVIDRISKRDEIIADIVKGTELACIPQPNKAD
jgi:sulfite reductase alpha subunit-like flavoprotein